MNLIKDRSRLANILFYIALTIELFFMVAEKSELSIPYISHVFRVTFMITLISLLILKRDLKEWIAVIAILGFTFICYRLTGRNELLRFSSFMLAARDVDLKKVEKYWFFFSAIGFAVIFLLSVLGIMGDIYIDADYGRGGIERRYVFGFGHPNTICGCVYMLLLLWIWLYGRKAQIAAYAAVTVACFCIYLLTVSRTFLMLSLVTITLAAIATFIPKTKEKKAVYISSAIIAPGLCLLFSIAAAATSVYYWNHDGLLHQIVRKVDGALNGRIANLYYNWYSHAGTLETWRLFSTPASEEYFDMGWIRLYYWYGIIPATIIVFLIFAIIYVCWKKKDVYTLILIFSLSVYTVIEATFVSRYIGRNFMLPIAAIYLYSLFNSLQSQDPGK